MFELPPLDDTALVLTVVGSTFLLRFLLAVRRLRRASGLGASLWQAAGRASAPGAFGSEREPERRHAMRQFTMGAVVSAAGLALALWVAIAGLLPSAAASAG